jgi:cytochrome P450
MEATVAEDELPGVIQLTPLNPTFKEDPHAILDPLRAQCPVYRDVAAGVFILTAHRDVRGVLSDTTMWRGADRAEEAAVFTRRALSAPPEGREIDPGRPRNSILTMDEPDHMRVREPFAKALYRRVAKSKALVQAVVDEWLNRIGDAKQFDAIAEFAVRVPIDVIARILGVDDSRLTEFRDWSEGIALGFNPFRTPEETTRMVDAANALTRYMKSLMAERSAALRDDLVSDMLALKAGGVPISDGEICVNLEALLIGGNLTTTDLIGNAIWLLLTHPVELAKLRADTSLIGSAVEEALRYESPVDITGRIASRDIDVGGCPIHQRQSMLMSLRGANRDPDAFRDPHRFDITRKDAPHVAFGGGLHLCIGAPLARLEASVALLSFFTRFPHLRLSDPKARPRWRGLPFFRGLEALDVTV